MSNAAIDNLTATGVAVLGDVPEKRPDLPGQNVEAVRFGCARSIREKVKQLNKEITNAKTAGLDVRIYQNGFSGGQVSVSVYETRRY